MDFAVSVRMGVQLGGVEVAQCVGGEIAEAPHAPMDVLKASMSVVGRAYDKEVFKLIVPSLWDPSNFKFSSQ
jgi:hypothetical protein